MLKPMDELMRRDWGPPVEWETGLNTAMRTQQLEYPPWPETWHWVKQQEPNTDPQASESDESGTDENWQCW